MPVSAEKRQDFDSPKNKDIATDLALRLKNSKAPHNDEPNENISLIQMSSNAMMAQLEMQVSPGCLI